MAVQASLSHTWSQTPEDRFSRDEAQIHSTFQIVIIFKGKSVRWYPVLWPYTVYRFSIPEEYSPLFKTGLSNSKIEQVLERSKVKKCLLVHPEVVIERVFEGALDSAEDAIKLMKISDITDCSAE